ncbi:phosphate ABC transporter permease subunit PstC [Pseudobacteroides cellulosolvens]|uniref:phosphate ABC transporter permease subunit PstC n=1 Tax=Pseudobacteroides cellulosolvens TaxID=35825 RepID=UPI00056B7ECC|nr:phosphate ABC transporter permease subunit PstC [Pseudobacteroides cellulosolvens]
MQQEYLVSEKNIISGDELANNEEIQQNRKWKKIREFIIEKTFLLIAVLSGIIILIIFVFIGIKSVKVFSENGIGFLTNLGFDQQIWKAARASADEPIKTFGVFGLIIGTLYTSIGALLISAPVGILTAVVITELAPVWLRRPFQIIIRYLASVPSVIYGLIGILVIVPFIKQFITIEMQAQYIGYFQMTGRSLLAGVIVLSFMILPIITALTIDALKAVPKRYREAAYSLGFSPWRTIIKVLIPSAKSGIFAGIILAIGAATGEAIAVSMVIGGIGIVPDPTQCISPVHSLFTPVLTLASAIVNKSETLTGEYTSSALFACGVLLLVTCTILSILSKAVDYIVKRRVGIE